MLARCFSHLKDPWFIDANLFNPWVRVALGENTLVTSDKSGENTSICAFAL
jgi:hypothetical protein